ncbi:MAG: ribosome-associated protein [Vicingaceae bacterium]|jgi:ribosome-associated protein|tara:strand:+ start:206 stop:409 length:204 start_codon:yes stop_codon:yes gene_type:complete
MNFELTEEYIELIKLLKLTGIAETGGMAKALVENEEVLWNGQIDTRKRLKVRRGDVIEVLDQKITIS